MRVNYGYYIKDIKKYYRKSVKALVTKKEVGQKKLVILNHLKFSEVCVAAPGGGLPLDGLPFRQVKSL